VSGLAKRGREAVLRQHGSVASGGTITRSNAERAAVLVKAIRASVSGDSSAICEMYTDDVRGWSPAMCISSTAELAVEFEDRENEFSDIELELAPLNVGGDQACVEWVASATHSGPLEIDSERVIEPTGRRFTLCGITIAEFMGGRICEFREYWDEIGLLEQLQLLPSD
jgi:ketosteroid isomerase-like protein